MITKTDFAQKVVLSLSITTRDKIFLDPSIISNFVKLISTIILDINIFCKEETAEHIQKICRDEHPNLFSRAFLKTHIKNVLKKEGRRYYNEVIDAIFDAGKNLSTREIQSLLLER